MKSLHISMIVVALFFSASTYSQIQSVSLQASGLTCSMCSRAIYKSLQKVPSVSHVTEDIEHSSYQISFSQPEKVSLANLKKAVTDAGFSVAWMKVSANFSNSAVADDSTLKINDLVFYFINLPSHTLNGEKKLLILNKEYISDKDRKKYPATGIGRSAGADASFQVTIVKS